jgi:hypothetical protein
MNTTSSTGIPALTTTLVQALEVTETPILPPPLPYRNGAGLVSKVEYKFKEDGSVDWREMIKPEFLYPRAEWFERRQLPVPESIENLEDNQLLVMLAGIKELAKLRGYKRVEYRTNHVSDQYVAVTCRIEWIKNYESDETTYEEVANATAFNTDGFCSKFLEAIAVNRAFVRCVRNFLNVHVLADEEVDHTKSGKNENYETPASRSTSSSITPVGLLIKTAMEKGKCEDFEAFKALLRKLWETGIYQNASAKEWTKWEDVPAKECRIIVRHLKK